LHDILSFLPIAFVALSVGYLLGSIPFGLLVTRLAGTADIRAIGSGNIGATNVLRTGRRGLAAVTLLGDMLKGTAAVLLADRLAGSDAGLIAGLGAVFGHVFPVWLRFSGGKGVATYLGALAAVAWPIALAFAGIWAAVAAISRYSSFSALVASALTPVMLWVFIERKAALLFAALTLVVWITHRANIARLIKGTEPRIGTRAPAASETQP
jgi:glycerol-3-phosphate acyltransferase PlsY